MQSKSRNQFRTKHFSAQTSLLTGQILELGVGNGKRRTNYGSHASVFSIDISLKQLKNIHNNSIDDLYQKLNNFSAADGNNLPFRSKCFDAAVISFTLCSVKNVEQIADELIRVTRPGARIIVLEHIKSPKYIIAMLQEFLTPAYSFLYNNCHLNRNPLITLEDAGFIFDEKKISNHVINPWLFLSGHRKT